MNIENKNCVKCSKCGKKLVPIGTSRKNGASHNDWDSRKLHKKCWLELNEEKYYKDKFKNLMESYGVK